MAQIARTGRFRLFDYGSAKANEAVYGSPQPPDILEQYSSLGEYKQLDCVRLESRSALPYLWMHEHLNSVLF